MLEILYQDLDIVAINKPSGLLTHRSPVDQGETRFALQTIRDQIGRRVYPVHRLDKPTSGVLLFALSKAMAAELGGQFMGHGIDKSYLAVVRGFAPESGVIDHPIRQKPDRLAGISDEQAPESAVTRFTRVDKVEWPDPVDRYSSTRYSLMVLRPLTGRRHQLRRHLKHIGHPIVGDTSYGKSSHNHYFQRRFGDARLLLHARSMGFKHPSTGKPVTVTANLDELFSRVLVEAGWSLNSMASMSHGLGTPD